MIRKNVRWIVLIILLAFAVPVILPVVSKFMGNDPSVPNPTVVKQLPEIDIPRFEADSAYLFTDKIVSYSPRIVGSAGAMRVKNWLVSQFKTFGAAVEEQPFEAKTFDGKTFKATNIVASYNPSATKRILLSAHWDSRPFSDSEKDKSIQSKPILGADDSGSSVGALLEIARQLQARPLSNVGVDIVLFDAEDYGDSTDVKDETQQARQNPTWCLGSQEWSRKALAAGYRPMYGINLDMISARDAKFLRDAVSLKYAPTVAEKVWRVGRYLGYAHLFVENTFNYELTDDHKMVNEIAKIPTINIINLRVDDSDPSSFGPHWHTQADNMSIIDKDILKAVGQTVLSVLHYEQAGAFQ
jgi:glutaminyl-peptide cyclotransferase